MWHDASYQFWYYNQNQIWKDDQQPGGDKLHDHQTQRVELDIRRSLGQYLLNHLERSTATS